MISMLTLTLLQALDAPVTQVTVYTDQARVVRTMQVELSGGEKQLAFPPLGDSIDTSSIRVEAPGAEVLNVEIERVRPEKLNTAEAKALIEKLDAANAEVNKLTADIGVLNEHQRMLATISPAVPQGDPLKPTPRMNASGWATSAQFLTDQMLVAHTAEHKTQLALRTAVEKRDLLAAQARKLGQPGNASGWQVTATVSGSGNKAVMLSYIVYQSTWVPQWDLQLLPDSNKVSLSLAALVSQRTNEDWANANLTLSTAVPSNAVKAPCLTTWKIGSAERFIPTPQPRYDNVAPAPPVRPMRQVGTEEDFVRQQLFAALAPAQAQPPAGKATRQPPKPSPQKREATFAPGRPAEPSVGNVFIEETSRRDVNQAVELEAEDDAAPPQDFAVNLPSAVPQGSALGMTSRRNQATVTGLAFAPPAAWRAPNYGADSPVMLAGGYDLTFTSLQKETVRAGDSSRRVALWSQQWPVTVERKVYPALSQDAFLVAELKNPSQQVLPGGPAQLFVGADPAGTARLKLVAPGESFTLPLGIDRAIKPVRNVQVVEAVQGMISKDDVSTYTVTTELVNPYRQPISLRVFDQVPVSKQKEVEVKLLESKPQAIQDAPNGGLEWRLNLQPQQKQVLTFTYTLKRPKDWRMQQQEVRP